MNISEYTVEHKVLTAQDWKDARDVSGASNMSGVMISFKDVFMKIHQEANLNNKDYAWRDHHPIAIIYAEKISQFTGYPQTMQWCEAFAIVEKMAA